MNICFASLDYPLPKPGGGVGTYVRLVARHLAAEGHQVTALALGKDRAVGVLEDEGVKVHLVPATPIHWYTYKIPFLGPVAVLPVREIERSYAVWNRVRAIHQQRPLNVIEVTEQAGLFASLLIKDVPTLVRLHGEEYTFHKYTPALSLTPALRLSRLIQRMAMRRGTLLVPNSQSHAEEIASELGPKRPTTRIVPICFDSTLLKQFESRPVEHSDNIVLFVGRLEHRKGIPLLLEAFGRVVRHLPHVTLVLIGAHHWTLAEEEVQHCLGQAGLTTRQVKFLGHLPVAQVYPWYAQATLCVLPSYYETFGVVAAEAMAFGIPVVATAAGSLPEVVKHDVTGLVVPPGDADALASAMLTLLDDAQLRRRMGEAGREWAWSRFTVETVASQMCALYRRLADGKVVHEPAGYRLAEQ